MTDYYFTSTPASASQPREITAHARNLTLQLRTDAGVFSKQGLDYGTRLLIESVTMQSTAKALDLGCGYGAVSAYLARVYQDSEWLLVDVNERALNLARLNLAPLINRTKFLLSDGFQQIADEKFDVIVLNPPIRAGKATIYRLFQESHDHLVHHGSLWVVIHKKHGALSAQKFLAGLFPTVLLVKRDAGYHIFRCALNNSLT